MDILITLKKVLVSGVTGQDGSHMVDYLLKNTNYLIYGMVRRSAKPDFSNIEEALKNERFKLVTGDLSDSQSIDNLVKEIKPDYFINLAAQSFVGSSWQIPEQTFDVGAMGVLRCLEAVRKHAPHCRFYNAGSSEEVGDVEYVPQDENHPPRPLSPYAAAKCAARGLVKVYRDSYNLYAIQGMLFNHEGTRRGEEFVTRKITKGVARIYHAIKNNQNFDPIELGALDSKRDWSDAEDFVRGIWTMLHQEKPYYIGHDPEYGMKFNQQFDNWQPKEYILSSNETHTVREFVELAFKEANLNGYWSFSGMINNIALPEHEVFRKYREEDGRRYGENTIFVKINSKFYRPADVNLLHGNSNLVRKELGWEPKTTFSELVRKMVKHDIENYKP